MIKSLWIILSTIAIANLLALIGFVAWLRADDRLDLDRLERVRVIFAQTRKQEQRKLLEERGKAEAEATARAEAARNELPPLTAAEKVANEQENDEVAKQRFERLRREVDDLRRTLVRERTELDGRRAALDKDIADFQAMRKRIADLEGNEQFKKTVALYQALPPAKAQALMQQLIDQGKADEVVAYLNAMETRAAKKVIEKFDDAKLAADLLERLRTRGVESRDPGKP